MRSLVIISLLVLWSVGVSAQKVEVFNDRFIPITPQLYLVSVGNSGVRTIDGNGHERYSFSERLMADVSEVYLTSALRPMLFFADIPAFQVLDNTLSTQTAAVNLANLGLANITLMAPTADNGYWAFDPVAQTLKRYDEMLTELTSSGDLRTIVRQMVQPTMMRTSKNRVYLLDPTIGIHVFDYYGGYLGLIIDTKGASSFDVRENALLTITNGTASLQISQTDRDPLFVFNKSRRIATSLADLIQGRILADRVYLSNGKTIESLPIKE